MMQVIKEFNDIEDIYKGKVPIEKDGLFYCPVCKAEYKLHKTAMNHMNKQECFNAVDVFKGTDREKVAFLFYKEIMATIAPNSRVTITNFRKNKLYKSIIQFTLFCSIHEVRNKDLYYAFIRDYYSFKHPTGVLSHGRKVSTLREFQAWLHNNPTFIDNETFFDRYMDDLLATEDGGLFLTRSIQKGHISILYILDVTGMDIDTLLSPVSTLYKEWLELHYHSLKGIKHAA